MFPPSEVARKPFLHLRSFAVGPLEQKAIKIERDEREHFLFPLLHERLFFGERLSDFVLHPRLASTMTNAARINWNSASGLPGTDLDSEVNHCRTPHKPMEKFLRQQSPTETPEEHFSTLLQRELTPHEQHLLELADIALQDKRIFRKDGRPTS